MFKKMIIALMLVLAMFSLVGCSSHTKSRTTTMTANGTIIRYYIDGTEVTQEIYENFGK